MMMVVAGTMIGGRAVVMELIVHIVMVGIVVSVVIGIMFGGVQRNVREHHVLMVVLPDHGVLEIAHNAGR